MNKPFHALSALIISIESDNHCHVWEIYPVQEVIPKSLGNSLLTDCAQPIEGVAFTADRISCQSVTPLEGVAFTADRICCQSVTPLEGVCSFGVRTNETINRGKRNKSTKNYPLEGVRVSAQNFSQSASSWFSSLNVVLPACFLKCWPFRIFFCVFTPGFIAFGSFTYFIGTFLFHFNFWSYWCVLFLFGSSIFQTVVMDSMNTNMDTNNDSFEQLLNQFVPMNQRWFSSDRARPRFFAGAVRPKRQTSVQRVAALKGQYTRILANFRSRRLWKFGPVGRSAQPVLSLDTLKSPVVAPNRKSLSGLVGILDSDVSSEVKDEDPSHA